MTFLKFVTSWKHRPLAAPTSAYVHIPFCRRRCFYCDFPISVIGDRQTGDNSQAIQKYVEILTSEIEATPASDRPLETIFFGGGTPSLLSAAQLSQLIDTLRCQFGLTDTAEISIEMDPGTFDEAKLQGFLNAGVNRISFGAQAFQDELLTVCGRSHSVADIYAAYDLLKASEAENISFDLISGLPYQNPQQWQDSLNRAISLSPPHISLYDLIVEPKTVFARRYEADTAPLPDSDTAAELYRQAQQQLTAAGYQHYEISNYARPGYPCRHNRTYWANLPYYGFGMGATSYTQGQRVARPRTRAEYADWVQAYRRCGGQLQAEAVSESDIVLETLMLRLRLAEGIEWAELRHNLTEETLARLETAIAPYLRQGWLLSDETRLRLSDPEGFLFSNTVLAKLFETLEDNAELRSHAA